MRKPEDIKTNVEKLKDGLTVGTVSPENFLESVLALDQADKSSDNSIRNREVLLSHEVKKIFSDQALTQRTRYLYFSLLSLVCFHLGQDLAIVGKHEEAVIHFKESLEAGENRQRVEAGEEYQDWILYIQGTIAYLENNLVELERCFNEIKETNKDVLERLLNGLNQRGKPDYKIDYINVFK
ncbi:MAG: hypothetical protein A2418_03305 [Candidatus Brennerbacteria bacterium RIFOXYC1_FULL_41_11]|uniref:Uncharacterized protein n=1 Tax=Candidatus Brennerbacteria bacterium RIFOXYD1_FULL_41_16 TaxID=1797529 RepID=A0A1G1XKZ1_9BACT|nr:MAG: hypothetical protein A2418_03305 [Candidatus Brennerbacteria bacterium RIFOXYC1_FULL_41_11]OGY40668.1 MAG: hypothetical protein A2570_00850 [Candidatus Brennerbacteria bacterium RIFOXYD1_FULL_41_16]